MNDAVVESPPLFLSCIPLIVMTLPFLVLIAFIAKRKGVNMAVAILVGLIPMVNFVFAFWLASKTDLEILSRLKEIEDRKS